MLSKFISLNTNITKFKKLIKRFGEGDQQKVLEAFEYAKKHHGDQVRDEGIPYIIHPVRVANILMEERDYYDPEVVMAALLHDVVEDTDVKIRHIEKKFGPEVKRLVAGLTRIKTRETKDIRFKKTMKSDYRVRMIKCADVLDNVRSWPLSTKTYKFPRWFKEVREMYLILAENTDKYFYDEIKKLINSKEYKQLLVE